MRKGPLKRAISVLAGGPGFEPGLAESESAVLPLDDPPSDYESEKLILTNMQRIWD